MADAVLSGCAGDGEWCVGSGAEAGPRANIWGKGEDSINLPPLADGSYGELTWKGVKVGTETAGPVTKDQVWTVRDVVAAGVTVGKESERFLFYRGVGHHEAPLSVIRRDGVFHAQPTMRGWAKSRR